MRDHPLAQPQSTCTATNAHRPTRSTRRLQTRHCCLVRRARASVFLLSSTSYLAKEPGFPEEVRVWRAAQRGANGHTVSQETGSAAARNCESTPSTDKPRHRGEPKHLSNSFVFVTICVSGSDLFVTHPETPAGEDRRSLFARRELTVMRPASGVAIEIGKRLKASQCAPFAKMNEARDLRTKLPRLCLHGFSILCIALLGVTKWDLLRLQLSLAARAAEARQGSPSSERGSVSASDR